MLKAQIRVTYNGNSIAKEFVASPNDKTDEKVLQQAAIYFYGVEHEFLTNHKPGDVLLMSVFDSVGRIIINGFYSPKGDQVIDLRKK